MTFRVTLSKKLETSLPESSLRNSGRQTGKLGMVPKLASHIILGNSSYHDANQKPCRRLASYEASLEKGNRPEQPVIKYDFVAVEGAIAL